MKEIIPSDYTEFSFCKIFANCFHVYPSGILNMLFSALFSPV